MVRFTLKALIFRGLSLLCVLVALGLLALYLSPKPVLLQHMDFSAVYMDRRGDVMHIGLTSDGKYRIRTVLGEIPQDFIQATLLYEDRSFWSHPGINPLALGRAALHMLGGGRRMGASTITMQVARLTAHMNSSSLWGKVQQMALALRLEAYYTKQEILEAYFNLASYGGSVEGVGAAARLWFHKDVTRLSLPESLALATVPQHPAARHPLKQSKNIPSAIQARHKLEQVWKERFQKSAGTSAPENFTALPLHAYSLQEAPFVAPHAVDMLKAMLGENPRMADAQGKVASTLSLRHQRLLEQSLKQVISRNAIWGMKNASALLLHWPSGEIRALAGSANFFSTSLQGQVNGMLGLRSPGSTLKPFIYALALEQGLIHPQSLLPDMPHSFGDYAPENADGRFQGPISAHKALLGSRNIPAIHLESRLTGKGLYDFLQPVVNFPFPKQHYGLSLVLGGAEVRGLDLASLYAMLASGGLWQEPILAKGQKTRPARAMLRPESAFMTLNMLLAPAPGGLSTPCPVYWKTGTSNGYKDAWTAGVFGDYVLVAWAGNFDGVGNPGFTGLNAAAPLFFNILFALNEQEILQDRQRGKTKSLDLILLDVCKDTGDLAGLCPETTKSWFIPGISPIADSGIYRQILIDEETGLRQCREIPGKTRTIVWEFWPSDLQKMFLQAGIMKPNPPALAPECLPEKLETAAQGQAPRIHSPRNGIVYARRLSEGLSIPLRASLEADATQIFWFAGTKLLGTTQADESFLWDAPPGLMEIRAVDDLGRGSSVRIEVESVP